MGDVGPTKIVEDNRRWRLRRLDDLLEALETCNEHDISSPPRPILEGLIAAGMDPKPTDTTTELIELVLDRQAGVPDQDPAREAPFAPAAGQGRHRRLAARGPQSGLDGLPVGGHQDALDPDVARKPGLSRLSELF